MQAQKRRDYSRLGGVYNQTLLWVRARSNLAQASNNHNHNQMQKPLRRYQEITPRKAWRPQNTQCALNVGTLRTPYACRHSAQGLI